MKISEQRLSQICKGEGTAIPPQEIIAMAMELEQLRTLQKPKQTNFPPDRQIVETNLGLAGRINGLWWKWWPEMGQFARKAMTGTVLWWYDEKSQMRYATAVAQPFPKPSHEQQEP